MSRVGDAAQVNMLCGPLDGLVSATAPGVAEAGSYALHLASCFLFVQGASWGPGNKIHKSLFVFCPLTLLLLLNVKENKSVFCCYVARQLYK